jgi:hypothetical protein
MFWAITLFQVTLRPESLSTTSTLSHATAPYITTARASFVLIFCINGIWNVYFIITRYPPKPIRCSSHIQHSCCPSPWFKKRRHPPWFFFFTMLHLPHDIFKGFMPGNNSLPHPQLAVFFLVRFHRHDDFLFFFFLLLTIGELWWYVRTFFFHALLCIFVFSDFICPVFHHGVSAVKYGGTYGSFFPRLG